MVARCSKWSLCLVVATAVAAARGAEKNEVKPPAAAPATVDLNLDGLWRGFVVEGRGEQPDRRAVHLELTVQGNRMTARRLDGQAGSLGQGTYTITRDRIYLIDATETRPRGKGHTYQGICTFGPDLMKWCVTTPGNKRPTTYETKGPQFLLILKRQRQASPGPAGKQGSADK